MFGRLRALWDRLAGWFFSNEESAVIVRQALLVLLKTGGMVLLSFARAKAVELEGTNFSGTEKANILRGQLQSRAQEEGLKLATREINRIVELAVGALEPTP